MKFRFSIDRGGTFTDVYAEITQSTNAGSKTKTKRVLKLLSVDPSNYPDAPREGIRRILEQETGIPHPRDVPLDTSRIESIRMGTTVGLVCVYLHIIGIMWLKLVQVATNALLERQGERAALVVTKGFRDLLQIANQSRPDIFDLEITKPDLLYERVVEVDEEVILPLGKTASRYGINAIFLLMLQYCAYMGRKVWNQSMTRHMCVCM